MSDPISSTPNSSLTGTPDGGETETFKKTQAEFYMKLGDRAWDRLKSKRNFEWRVAFGIWSAFAAGAGFVLTSTIAVGLLSLVIGSLLATGMVWFFWWFWLPYMNQTIGEDWTRVIAWENEAIQLLQLKDPLPPNRKQYMRLGLHKAQWMQFVVSALFALLFIGALSMKWAAGTSTSHPSTVSVEGGSLDIDSTTLKLHLGK
jgi:hypothetical protein